jgi:hypothetical protein
MKPLDCYGPTMNVRGKLDIRDLPPRSRLKQKKDKQAQQAFSFFSYRAKDGSRVIIVDPAFCDLLQLPEPSA